ncbi:predicted general secretion pathway protein [Desulfobacula toluolica Tol2]|uniref:Predicted general secretion pathway protein n=2 Tax=Desulfobacula toluolica TaxID=28223 RepID=K0NNY3_DESTT|nr:predicted general secretion pathway protein [Desulfobacula toluolica Tol2]
MEKGYKSFYLMEKEPFDCHPSPEIFYKSKAHQNCWNYLLQGTKTNDPIFLVSGNYGSGKTLLSLKLISELKKDNRNSVYISTPTYDFSMLLEKILVELGITVEKTDELNELKLRKTVYDYFEKDSTDEKKKYIYLVIDDAQEFSDSYLTKLRLFASYNYLGYFPIRIFLFAHKNFLKTLNDQKNIALGQRIKRIYSLEDFDFEDIKEYIYFRLIHSGASGTPVFEDEAISAIETISKGNPRIINNICDNCLLVAGNQKLNQIDKSIVNQAVDAANMVGIEKTHPPGNSPSTDEKPKQTFVKKALPANKVYPYKDADIEAALARKPEKDLSENDLYEKKTKKNNLKDFGSRYGKTGILTILILIILFLLGYIFNQNRSDELSRLESNRDQIIRSVPADNYIVDHSLLFQKNPMQII